MNQAKLQLTLVLARPIHFWSIQQRSEAAVEDQSRLDNGICKPVPEQLDVAESIRLAIFVQFRILDQSLFFIFRIHRSIENYRQRGEDCIIELHQPVIVNVLARKARVDSKNEGRSYEEQVFVDAIVNQVGIFPVALSAMEKQQSSELLELTKRVS